MNDSRWHVPLALMDAYLSLELGEVASWSVEAHLDECAPCRDQLAVRMAGSRGAHTVESVRLDLAARLDHESDPASAFARAQGLRSIIGPAWSLPWILSLFVVLGLAAGLDSSWSAVNHELVLLIAPALPLLGIAGCTGRWVDPAHEITAATPTAGLRLVLLRSVAVLVVCLPPTAVAGLVDGQSGLAVWLLPCLGLTSAALFIGTMIGLIRAALGTGVAWMIAVVSPSLAGVDADRPLPLATVSQPIWAVAVVVLVALLLARRQGYDHLETG
jgi:hypothetical protein